MSHWTTVPPSNPSYQLVSLPVYFLLGEDPLEKEMAPHSTGLPWIKSLPAMWETQVQSLGQEDPLEKEMATLSSVLPWRIPWTEELGGL